MTHSDIYTKFMIEYDKANVTSSYPSLTDYEIATLLDKAYLAIIAQKLTGNNQRRMPFEGDVKAIEDIKGLISTTYLQSHKASTGDFVLEFDDTPSRPGAFDQNAINEVVYEFPKDMLYYVSSIVKAVTDNKAIDNMSHIRQTVIPISHTDAQKFKATDSNLPWIKNPVMYMDGNTGHLLFDSFKYSWSQGSFQLALTYIRKPEKFVDHLDGTQGDTQFELSDSVAEELINQAIIFAAETVESPRLQTKSNILSLEA